MGLHSRGQTLHAWTKIILPTNQLVIISIKLYSIIIDNLSIIPLNIIFSIDFL